MSETHNAVLRFIEQQYFKQNRMTRLQYYRQGVSFKAFMSNMTPLEPKNVVKIINACEMDWLRSLGLGGRR